MYLYTENINPVYCFLHAALKIWSGSFFLVLFHFCVFTVHLKRTTKMRHPSLGPKGPIHHYLGLRAPYVDRSIIQLPHRTTTALLHHACRPIHNHPFNLRRANDSMLVDFFPQKWQRQDVF